MSYRNLRLFAIKDQSTKRRKSKIGKITNIVTQESKKSNIARKIYNLLRSDELVEFHQAISRLQTTVPALGQVGLISDLFYFVNVKYILNKTITI